ncbi:hypothetical protein HAX54_035575, partial [Datura stramonium]|nr:hypothetical protein [Datura stramonium]
MNSSKRSNREKASVSSKSKGKDKAKEQQNPTNRKDDIIFCVKDMKEYYLNYQG